MKSLFNYIVLLMLVLFASSCNKYLDITPKGKIVIETADDLYNLVSYPGRGYPVNQFQYLIDDMWIRESYIIGQPKGINSIHFLFDDSESRLLYVNAWSVYNQTYKYINRWNMICTHIGDASGSDSIKARAFAEARVFRAFDHFLLVNLYAKQYDPATATLDGGICIMDKFDLESVPAQASVAEVYAFILKDLDEAIPHLQVVPKDVYHPSLAFAWALKAKVHLFKKEFDKAKEAALKSLSYNNSIYDLVEYTKLGGPSKVNVPAGVNPETLSYMYMTGYNEMNFAGSAFMFSKEFTSLFSKNDARFNLFFTTTGANVGDAGTSAWNNTKYTAFFYPTVGMKTPEVHLMLAECYAREGNLEEAMKVINALRAKRITLTSEATLATPSTVKATMDIVIAERRKELLFGFNRFWDLRRFNTEPEYAKTVVRKFPVINTSVPQLTYTLAPDSKLYILPFGTDVLKLNPALKVNSGEALPW